MTHTISTNSARSSSDSSNASFRTIDLSTSNNDNRLSDSMATGVPSRVAYAIRSRVSSFGSMLFSGATRAANYMNRPDWIGQTKRTVQPYKNSHSNDMETEGQAPDKPEQKFLFGTPILDAMNDVRSDFNNGSQGRALAKSFLYVAPTAAAKLVATAAFIIPVVVTDLVKGCISFFNDAVKANGED
ncbi:MAG: hypothetical protein ACOYK6_05455 [Chthoniobacterales bacterium]